MSCRQTVIDVIPDKETMLAIVDQIVDFEDMLKRGESLTREQEKEHKALKPVAKELKKVQSKMPRRALILSNER